jgi:hypothetical protein
MKASYTVNLQAVARARQLIDARQYVLKSVWSDVQPSAEDENAFLESHSWEEYAQWHLALTDGAGDQTKARYAFVYGDFRRVHRMGLIACQYRAAEWRHKQVELAAHGGRGCESCDSCRCCCWTPAPAGPRWEVNVIFKRAPTVARLGPSFRSTGRAAPCRRSPCPG